MRVIVIGGGASGVSTALALAELQQSSQMQMQVELWEPGEVLGGMASSAQTPEGEWYNNGVQGVHESFVHTRALLTAAGFGAETLRPTSLTSCFVTPPPGGIWISGVTDMSRYKRSIKCFKRMCKAVGHPVAQLTRIAFCGIQAGDLKPGEWRYLTDDEVGTLRGKTGL